VIGVRPEPASQLPLTGTLRYNTNCDGSESHCHSGETVLNSLTEE